MFEEFENYMATVVKLTPAEIGQVRALATVKKLKRKERLLKEGEVCLYKGFVATGLLKTCFVRDNGLEYIMRFSPENSWAVDLVSFSKGIPAKYSIEALEPSVLLLWAKAQFATLHESIPALKSYMGKLIMSTVYDSHDRIKSNISYTSEEKYQDFVDSFPDLSRRLPLHTVAAYLGISRETLSRIRHAQLKKG